MAKTKKGEKSPEICLSHKSEDSLERLLRQRKGSLERIFIDEKCE
jgi:hypothetical protein